MQREEARLRFADPAGLRFELAIDDVSDPPLAAAAPAPDVPGGHRLLGFAGVAAYASDPDSA